jgi:hypothetical protein
LGVEDSDIEINSVGTHSSPTLKGYPWAPGAGLPGASPHPMKTNSNKKVQLPLFFRQPHRKVKKGIFFLYSYSSKAETLLPCIPHRDQF